MHSKILDFYNGISGNQNGDFWKDILEKNDDWLEVDHDYIQYLFPSNEPSNLNFEAPTLTKEECEVFENSDILKEKLKKSFIRFLKFLDLRLEENGGLIEVKGENEVLWWLKGFNHNMLRITRCLKSLKLLGLSRYSLAFFNFLITCKEKVSSNTYNHWSKAVFDNLWDSQPKFTNGINYVKI